MSPRKDDNEFRVRPGPPKSRGSAPKSKFISRIVKQSARTGRMIGRTLPSARSSRTKKPFGRGQVAARLAGQSLTPRARRVSVKIRPVRLQATSRGTAEHLRYISRQSAARDGAAREGERGRLFGAISEDVDAAEFAERGKADRHNFRMIVSPEDGADLGDLKNYARDLMSQVERDLGTRLEWVAADHWDTDRPHVHILMRGKDEAGEDLVISPEYISHGVRARASELATEWLGPRTELEIRESLRREVTQERWTSLDLTLVAQSIDLRVAMKVDDTSAEARFRSGLLLGRLDHLVQLGLAIKQDSMRYELAPHVEATLRTMGERGDIVQTMQRAMGSERREFAFFDHTTDAQPIVGRLADKGLVDEMSDRAYLVVDATDGRAYHVALPLSTTLEEFPLGSILEVHSGAEPRRADANIERVAVDGLYSVERHRQIAREYATSKGDPDAFVQAHVRRLEALRRAQIVERLSDGQWRIPADFGARARAYDAERAQGARVELRSHLPLERQVRAIGATWLDQQLVKPSVRMAPQGFGGDALVAMQSREAVLVDRGLAEHRSGRMLLTRNVLDHLRLQELGEAAKRIENETGLHHRPVRDGERVSGTYRRSIQLTSGRFAMLDDGTGFSLVPWRPVIEQRLGREMSAVVRGNFTSFEFGRSQGLGI